MSEQLTFELPVRPARGREAFFVAPSNARAVAMLDAPESWPAGKLLLVGPEASGKSHLAHVWAEASGATVLAAADLTEAAVPELARGDVVLEDLPAPGAETALFHLHNLLAAERRKLLMTARTAPSAWRIGLRDLASRVEATTLVQLSPPDDALLGAVLVKHFSDRQIAVSPALITYLVARIERSFAAAHEIVGRLDAEALRRKRPVSRSLAAEVLDKSPDGGA